MTSWQGATYKWRWDQGGERGQSCHGVRWGESLLGKPGFPLTAAEIAPLLPETGLQAGWTYCCDWKCQLGCLARGAHCHDTGQQPGCWDRGVHRSGQGQYLECQARLAHCSDPGQEGGLNGWMDTRAFCRGVGQTGGPREVLPRVLPFAGLLPWPQLGLCKLLGPWLTLANKGEQDRGMEGSSSVASGYSHVL